MKKLLILVIGLSSLWLQAEISQDDQQFLSQKFAPYLKLHPSELSLPASVEWYFERTELKKWDGKKELPVTRNPTAAIIAALPEEGKGYFLKPRDTKNTYRGMPAVNNIAQAPTYVNIVERDNEKVIIDYIYFYPYQAQLPILPGLNSKIFKLVKKVIPTNKIGIHEGDWEHNIVYLKKVGNSGDPNVDYEMDQVFYGRHQQHRGNLLRADQVKRVNDYMQEDQKGTHPIVWIGKHSHAGYPKRVNLSTDFDVTAEGGVQWPTWRNIKLIGPFDHPNSSMEWIKAKQMRWGSTRAASVKIPGINRSIEYHGNSPTTPSRLKWYAMAGQTKAKIKTVTLLATRNKQGNYSDFFDIEIPARFRNIEFAINHPEADYIRFDLYEYRRGGRLRSDKKIYSDIRGTSSIRPRPNARSIKNLYFKNLIIPTEFKSTTPKIEVEIFGIEE